MPTQELAEPGWDGQIAADHDFARSCVTKMQNNSTNSLAGYRTAGSPGSTNPDFTGRRRRRKEGEGRKDSGKWLPTSWSSLSSTSSHRVETLRCFTTLQSHLQWLPATLPPQTQDDPPGSWPRCSSLAHVTCKEGQESQMHGVSCCPFPGDGAAGEVRCKPRSLQLHSARQVLSIGSCWSSCLLCWPETSSQQPAQPHHKQKLPMRTEPQLGRWAETVLVPPFHKFWGYSSVPVLRDSGLEVSSSEFPQVTSN